MLYAVVAAAGVIAGGICVFLALAGWRWQVGERARQVESTRESANERLAASRLKELELHEQVSSFEAEKSRFAAEKGRFDAAVITYRELHNENAILKHDLQNVDVNLRKLQLDGEVQQENQAELDRRGAELGSRYLKENVNWIASSLSPNNYANCKKRLENVIERCRGIGHEVAKKEEGALLANLRKNFEKVVRAAHEREEQARIKAQIREEQKLEREVEREVQRVERERAAVQEALEKALAEAKDKHGDEIEKLRARLAEAERNAERAKSRAQLTKSGHVYVLSNIGSFGDGVFKIGMTRRLEPMDRVRELGDASVPFGFDVHMMISSDNAPALENEMHRALHKLRINKVNLRKEFFRTDIEAIRGIVQKQHGDVEYVADAEALQYYESIEMTEEDAAFIEGAYDHAVRADGDGKAS